MARYFVTGSTGFIGKELAVRLLKADNQVHILVRDKKKAEDLINVNTSVFEGNITDYTMVEKAMQGCSYVFHLAAHAKSFDEDPSVFDKININGTRNILEAALKNGILKVVFTSTAGTFDVTTDCEDANEQSQKPDEYFTDYTRTKREAEMLCDHYYKMGLNIVIVNPTRVFGHGLIGESNSITRILKLYCQGKWRIIPGSGNTYGNYVFVDDVVEGHLMAMAKGKPGDSYILGGENLTFNNLFASIKKASCRNYTLFHIPYPILWTGAAIMVAFARLFKRRPLISPAWVTRYLQHRRLTSKKAVEELGYRITPVEKGLKLTIKWLKDNELNDEKQP